MANARPVEVQRQLCLCGCGKVTPIASETRPKRGWVLGESMPYYPHHSKNRWPMTDGIIKRCQKCCEDKPVKEFAKNMSSRDFLQHRCRDCSKAVTYKYRLTSGGKVRVAVGRLKNRLKVYRLSPDDYEILLAVQNYCCAICRKPETLMMRGSTIALAVDHDHETGKVRGLLCSACNHAIGKLGEDPVVIRRAAEYVEQGGML